ncbi:MAG TPA: hypothetical protein VNU26_04480 [Mycobacteriales bacterium]|nr:hypothetical protein [Mycobacteriales bacterium]
MSEPVHEPLSFVSTFVWSGMEPLRLVVHGTDDSWQFLCNTTADPQFILTMHADHVFERFALDLQDLSELPRGYLAVRESPSEHWLIEPDDDE